MSSTGTKSKTPSGAKKPQKSAGPSQPAAKGKAASPGPKKAAPGAAQPATRSKATPPVSPTPENRAQAGAPGSSAAPGRRLLHFFARFRRFAGDIASVALLALALMTLVGLLLPRLGGGILNWWTGFLKGWAGWGSLWVVLMLGLGGVWMLRRQHSPEWKRLPWARVLALEAAAFTSVTLLAVLGGASLERAEAGLDGGRIGWALAELLRLVLTPLGLGAAFWRVLLVGFLLALSLVTASGLVQKIYAWNRRAALSAQPTPGAGMAAEPAVHEIPTPGLSGPSPAEAQLRKKAAQLPPEFRKNFRVAPETSAAPPVGIARDERLPPFDLLVNEQHSRPDERHINLTAGLIEKTLSEFGIPAKVVGFRVGPTVTQFAVEPGFLEKEKPGSEGDMARQKIRVAQISSLQRDLALALSASRLRIEAPVPGRPYVGIEVPNTRTTLVRLRPILESELFFRTNSPLAVGLGRDVSGAPVVADLSRMPHLLIAGTTGSGKSICIEAIAACLIMNNLPEDLRLVMIDPKMVELVRFNGAPHLLGKVETNLERILTVLRWTVAEMDRRYKLLEISHSRNLETYNHKVVKRKGEKPLPRIVLILDELADLMMSAPEETEHNVVRLAQMARATGIHLVVATQRPSTDVVTGLIKANFPARISFAVASSIDSRVILDTTGAESLLGRGDMLFLPPEASAPIRSQGVIVTDQEIDKIIAFWNKTLTEGGSEAAPPWEEMINQEAVLADRDNLIQQAIEIARQERRIGASMLQRRLRIGYPRAARLVDELEDLGIIGPAQGGGRERDVLIQEGDTPGEGA